VEALSAIVEDAFTNYIETGPGLLETAHETMHYLPGIFFRFRKELLGGKS